MSIVKMTHQNMKDYSKSHDSFEVFGRIVPKYENDQWTYTEELFSKSYVKQYDDEEIDSSYVEDQNKAVFLFYKEEECIGRIRLRKYWNGFAYIDYIGVIPKYRQLGAGTALLSAAAEWAKQNNFIGLMLESQDVNVSACRFYAKNHFVIGGVDNMLYANFQTAKEKAIFWYYKF